MPFSTFLGNHIIDHLFRNQAYSPPSTIYVSLHTADPGLTGANEVSGGSYARQSFTFDAASSKASQNAAAISFTAMPAVTVTHVGVWDASTNGNFLIGGALTAQKTTNAGDTFQFPDSDLDLAIT
jgi:hypothetical protein